MSRYQSVASVATDFQVRDIDDAIRTLKRHHNLPFYQKMSSLKVFSGVYVYPPATDHDYLIYLDRPQTDLPFNDKLRARYTSFQQFFEDPDNHNQVAEIWQSNSLLLGVNDKDGQYQGLGQQQLDSAQSIADHTASGDANNLRIDNVNFLQGDASIAFTITADPGVGTITDTFSSFTDSNYQRKWYFRSVYLSDLPDNVILRYGADASNYMTATLTTQFAGQPLMANQWNLVAFDLNNPTTVGTITDSTVFAYETLSLTNAPTGTYNLGASYIRAWELLDYWYQSKYAVITSGSTIPDREFFYDEDAGTYDTNDALAGVDEWADVVMYTAIENTLIDKENQAVLNEIKQKKQLAWDDLKKIWPDPKPQETTNPYIFSTDYQLPTGYGSGPSWW